MKFNTIQGVRILLRLLLTFTGIPISGKRFSKKLGLSKDPDGNSTGEMCQKLTDCIEHCYMRPAISGVSTLHKKYNSRHIMKHNPLIVDNTKKYILTLCFVCEELFD